MLFAIHALDKPGALSTRLAHYEAHKSFLADTAAFGLSIAMSGPLTSDDGSTMIGSLFLVEAPDRAAVERFNQADPFYGAGIWESVAITRFNRRQGSRAADILSGGAPRGRCGSAVGEVLGQARVR